MAAMGFGLAPPAHSHVLMFAKPSALCNVKVTKRPPLLVTPNSSTPSHPLYLTNIDDQLGLRIHVNILLFYRSHYMASSMKNEDPVPSIKKALAKLLVHYYPFAGRVRDADDKGKLIVHCTGEGILFVEADADISLEDFGVLSPPVPRALDFVNYDKTQGSHSTTIVLHHGFDQPRVMKEHLQSVINLAELNGRPLDKPIGVYCTSYVFKEVDFGWGKAVHASIVYQPKLNVSFLIRPSVNAFEGFLVPISLMSTAMQVFEQEINKAIHECLQRQ